MRKIVERKNIKSNKGITLIALVITIIVLLLLSGVAISMLAGENGIITKAKYAAQEQERANIQDLTIAGYYYKLIAATQDFKYLDMEKTAQGIYSNLTSNGYKLTKADGSVVATANELLSSENGVNTISLNVEGKHGDYKGEVTDTGLKEDIEIVGTTPEETPPEVPEEPEQPEEPKVEVTIENLKETGDPVTENITLIDVNEQQIVIPSNFRIASDSATTIKDGIVVVAPDESEFVWVPVEDINSMVMCQSHTQTSDCSIVESNDGKLMCQNHTNTAICGKLYSTTTGENFDSTLTSQTYTEGSGLRESTILAHTYYGDGVTETSNRGIELIKNIVEISGKNDTEVLDLWQTQLQEEYETMAKSVCKYKGFYVGRYETSLKVLEDGVTKVAQSMKNKESATPASNSANTWYGLYQKEKEYSINNSLTDIVGSTMIWGCQYDQMMLWMKANGIDIDISQTESPQLKGAEKNTDPLTGKEGDKDILNNVYDLLGCKREWTLEGNNETHRVFRGSSSSGTSSPSARGTKYPSNAFGTDETITSRIALFIE